MHAICRGNDTRQNVFHRKCSTFVYSLQTRPGRQAIIIIIILTRLSKPQTSYADSIIGEISRKNIWHVHCIGGDRGDGWKTACVLPPAAYRLPGRPVHLVCPHLQPTALPALTGKDSHPLLKSVLPCLSSLSNIVALMSESASSMRYLYRRVVFVTFMQLIEATAGQG